jgi:sirohydrochlorin ferrochelatase
MHDAATGSEVVTHRARARRGCRMMRDLALPDGFDRRSTGIVIVDHGSRRADSNERHEAFVADWRTESGYPIVEPAHMECAEPSIATAFAACVEAGATTVVVAPYFLWPGNHWDRDIPELTAAAATGHGHVRYVVTAPLGPHRLLMDIVADRITSCLAHVAGEGTECDLCAGTGRCRLRTPPN